MDRNEAIKKANRLRTLISVAQLEIEGQPHTFRFFESSRELVTKIISGETYPTLPFLDSVETIFDIGASVGTASLFFHAAHLDAKIWAFEPHRQSFELLQSNLAPLPNAKVFNIGLFDRSCDSILNLSFYDFPTNSIGNSVLNSDAKEKVRLESARDFAREHGIRRIDILKVDTEGCEIPILTDLLAEYSPQAIYLEYHSEKDRLEIDRMLESDYILYFGTVPHPHRGELCYVAKAAIPADDKLMRMEIDIAGN